MSTKFEYKIEAPGGEFTQIKIGTYDVFSVDVENWNNTYTTMGHNMGNWNSTYTTLSSVSGDWQNIKMIVDTSRNDWDATATHVSHNMNSWSRTYTAVATTSADWNDVYTHVQTTSSSWNHGAAGYATPSDIETAISDLVDSAPATLNTLNELASALGDDANFSTTITNQIGTKWTQDNTKISNWDSTYSSVSTNSADWNDVYSHVQTTSSSWGGAAGYTTDIGNNSDTTIEVTHNLNTNYITYSLIDNNTNEFVNTQTSIVDANKIQFVFTTAPTTNEYKVVIISTDGTATGGGSGSGGTSYTDSDVASYLNGNLDTHIIPDTNAAYDLGNAEYKIRHLFLSSNSLYMGDDNTPIRLNSNKKLVVDDVEVGSSITSYINSELPTVATNGTIALDTDNNSPVYFMNGKWKKLSDDTDVADNRMELEVYLLAGQSNAGGTALDSEFSTFTQTDGTGTLSDTREQILFSSNSNSDYNNTPVILNPGGQHGIELSFLDKIDNIREKKQLLVKYYSGGSKIETWEKDAGENNWTKMIASVDHIISWAAENGYSLDWKGLVWFQGESDAGDDQADHKSKLQQLITNIRTHLNKNETDYELPVCLIQPDNRTATFDEYGNYVRSTRVTTIETVRGAQQEVADEDPRVELIDTDTYSDLMDWNDANHGIHWQAEAYVGMGIDAATRMDQIIEGTLVYSPPDPNLWFDASDSSTVTHNGATQQQVSEWRDKSGNNYHVTQSTSNKQAVYNLTPLNGKNTMQFNTSRQFTRDTPDPADFRDVYVVAQWEGGDPFTHTSDSVKGLFTGAKNDNPNQGIQTGLNTRKLYAHSERFYDDIILNGSAFDINDDIIDYLKVPFCINVRCNSYKPLTGFSISRDRKLDGRGWKGRIAEIVCFDHLLTDEERHKLEGYLAHKWGTTSTLPENHPYKTTAP